MPSLIQVVKSLDPVMDFAEVAERLYEHDMDVWKEGGRVGNPPSKVSPGACQKLAERGLKKLHRLCRERGLEEWI